MTRIVDTLLNNDGTPLANGVIIFERADPVFAVDGVYPPRTEAITAVDGSFDVTLAAPGVYKVLFPNDTKRRTGIVNPSDTPISLALMLAPSAVEPNALQVLIEQERAAMMAYIFARLAGIGIDIDYNPLTDTITLTGGGTVPPDDEAGYATGMDWPFTYA